MRKQGFTHESTYNESKEWYTPRWIFISLGLEFDLDPASPGAEKVPWIPAKKHLIWPRGLLDEWKGRIWLNPPYGSDTPEWLQHLCMGYFAGSCTGIALVFARTDTDWFQRWAIHADAMCFLQGRIHFVPEKDAARYAKMEIALMGASGAGSLLLAYGEKEAETLENFQDKGLVVHKEGYCYELPISKPAEMFSEGERFAGDKTGALSSTAPAYENLPGHAESGQLFSDKS